MKFSLLYLLLLPLNLLSQTTFSLNQCLETAWANNLQVKQATIQTQTAEANFNQAKNNRLPVFNGNYNFGLNNGRSIDPFTNGYVNEQLSSSNLGISGSLMLYNGARLQNLIKQNQTLLQAAKWDVQQEKDKLTLAVILAYLQVLNSEDLLELAFNQSNVTDKQVERLTKMNKIGAISPANLYDMQGQFANDKLAIVNARNALAAAKLALCQLMNQPYNETLKVERLPDLATPSVFVGTTTEIFESAAKNMAIIKASESRQQGLLTGIDVVKSNYYPRIALFGQWGTNFSSAARLQNEKIPYFNQFNNNRNSYLGLNVQIPIFNAFQTRTAVNLAKIQVQEIDNQNNILKQQLRQAIEQAHLDLNASYARYTTLQEQVEAFKASFAVAEKRFTEGVIPSTDYLIVKNNLDRAKANLVNAQYEYVLRLKILDFYRK